jgi:hypothetical protein
VSTVRMMYGVNSYRTEQQSVNCKIHLPRRHNVKFSNVKIFTGTYIHAIL